MMLALLTGLAFLAAASLPLVVFKLLIPLSDRLICVVYACLMVVMVIVMPPILKRMTRL
jgi:hypothetical protein